MSVNSLENFLKWEAEINRAIGAIHADNEIVGKAVEIICPERSSRHLYLLLAALSVVALCVGIGLGGFLWL